MPVPEEIFDVVDRRNRVIGRAARRTVHADRLRHRAVHVLLFNSRAELWVQKRSTTKDTFPGCYDSSASGHLNTGESYRHAAYREMAEELGLVLPAKNLHRRFKINAGVDTGWEFVWVYTGQSDMTPVPDPTEVVSVTAMTLEQVLRLPPVAYARSFRRVIRELCARGYWEQNQ